MGDAGRFMKRVGISPQDLKTRHQE
jgi:hypothetical protein